MNNLYFSADTMQSDYAYNDLAVEKTKEIFKNSGLYIDENKFNEFGCDVYAYASELDAMTGNNVLFGIELEICNSKSWNEHHQLDYHTFLNRKRKQLKYPFITFYLRYNYDLTQAVILPHSRIYTYPAKVKNFSGGVSDLMFIVPNSDFISNNTSDIVEIIKYYITSLVSTKYINLNKAQFIQACTIANRFCEVMFSDFDIRNIYKDYVVNHLNDMTIADITQTIYEKDKEIRESTHCFR